ncbi:uncharacterized protein LOC100894089 [Strongylocentrotus purpuratus]|uniref:GAIN-B domain-containing protein n=1 Tax=Strongylocentrotus purpuratus TaxID=7668 RepID=A0A7M7P2P9_STRPU|nr:uncharacterized protein LOC100894089 [Strongylocentrotus purpuratus]
MRALTVLLLTALLVAMVTGQTSYPPYPTSYYPDNPYPYPDYPDPEPQPFQNPGEIIPGSGFNIEFLINAAGGIWQQDRVIDSMAYVCKDVLPVVGSMIPEVDPTSLYWGFVCDEVIEASKDLDAFDATGFCNDIITVITDLISQESGERYRRQAEYMDDPLGIIEILTNITRDLYGIDINMIINDPSTINTICTNVKKNFLRPSLEDLISQFATELMSAFLPQAAPICDNWEGFLEDLELDSTSPVYHIIEKAANIGSQAVGYDDFDALCEAITQALENDDIDARRTFSRNVIESVIDLLENGERCTALGNYAITSLGDNSALNSGGIDYYPSSYSIDHLLYLYTGFYTAEDICYALEEAFTTEVELPTPRVDFIPGTNLTLKFFVNAAGGLWQQDRLVDTLDYACTDALPAITVMVPVVGYYRHYYNPICQEIREAARDLEAFDSTGFCDRIMDMISDISPGDTDGGNGTYDIAGSIPDPMGIIGTLVNITRELYGININDISTICPNVHQFLDQPLPGIFLEFGTKLMSSLLPLAEQVCDWDAFLEGFGVDSSSTYYQIIEDAASIGSQAVGYDSREALCQDLVRAISAEGDEASMTFSRNIIIRMFELPTDADRCSILVSETLEGVLEPVLQNVLPNGPSVHISDYLISRYTGYENVYEICQDVETAFTSEVPLVRPTYGELFPDSGLTVSLLINLAGSLWEQDRAVDSYAYVCTDILPIIARTIPDFRGTERYWKPICNSIVEAADDSNGFDATGLCYDLERRFSSLLGPVMTEETYPEVPPYNMSSEGNWSYTYETMVYVSPFVQLLMNISEIYGIDINNISTVCSIASDLLEPSLSDLVLDFGSRILSFFLPQASPICEDVDAFLSSTLTSFGIVPSSPYYQVIQDAIDIAPRLVGYNSIDAICQQMNQALQNEDIDDSARLDFTRGLISNLLSLTTAVGRCGSIADDIIHDVIEPLINIVNPGERFNITDDLIHQYTGFMGVQPICRALASAFRGCPKRFDLDACGVCVPRLAGSIEYHFTSDERDCTGRCPRDDDYGAILNECGRCVAGATGRPVDAGMNECGSCGYLGGRSCVGCDGVINSGNVYDACMVCGGNGTSCTDVSSIYPNVIPAATQHEITISGAGFDPAPDCRFRNQVGTLNRQVTMATSSASEGTCTITLPAAGTYDLLLIFPGNSEPIATSITLEVYDPVTIASVAPEEITLDPTSLATFTFTASANSNFQAVEGITPYLIFENGLEPLAGEISGDSMQELTFTLRSPPTPMELVVSPSLNGIDPLPGGPFTVTFFAPAPAIGSLTFFPSKNRLLLDFEDGVRTDDIDDCSTVFQDTPEENGIARNILGTGSSCMIIRGNRVIMITLGDGDDLIGPDDTLTLRGDVIFSRPDFSRAVPETVLAVEVGEIPTVEVVLRGFSKISSCGEVQLSARGTKGGAGRPLTFTWSVQSEGGVSNDLEAAVTAITTADLTVDGALLTANQVYTFITEAVNFLGGSGSDSIVVTRSAEQVPDLGINPRGIEPENVPVSKRFFLDADVTFYSDCDGAGPEETDFVWTANSETFDESIHSGTANFRTLFINAYSFPGDSDVTFTVQARRVGATSGPTSAITIRFASSELVASIRGGSEKSVGVDSGMVILDGSRSRDPDQPTGSDQSDSNDLTYEWSCEQTTDDTYCASAQDGSMFPADNATSSSTLTFDADDMTPGKTYQFTLDVASGNRRASTSALIDAVAGNPPLILVFRSTEGPVLSTEPVSLTALIGHASPDVIAWTITGHDIDLDYDLDGNAGDFPIPSQTLSFTSIDAGILQPGEMYTVDVTVTYGSDQTAYGQLVLDVAEGISSCQVSLESGDAYTVLDEIAFLVDDCVTDEGAYPLTYQLFVTRNDAGNTRSLTRSGGDSRISVRGPPVRRNGDGENTFVIEVCNQHSSCTSYTITASVQDRQSIDYEELKQAIVDGEAFKGDFISALRNINALIRVLSDQQTGRKKRATTTGQQTADQLMLLREAVDGTVLDVSSATTLLDECPSIEVNDLSEEDLESFVSILQTLVSVFFSEMEVLPPSTYEALVPITAEIGEATEDEDILDMLRDLVRSLTRASLVRDTVGDVAVETVSSGVTSSAIVALPQGAHQSHSGADALTVDFGTDVAERYGVWDCESGSCVGVLVEFEQYADDSDPYSTNDEDRNDRASAILQISLFDPSSFSELVVDSLTDPISIHMEITRPKQYRTYECTFWNTTSKEWSTSGVETVMTSGTEVECRTNHLSAFSVLAGEEIASTSGPSPTSGSSPTSGPSPTNGPSPGEKSNIAIIVGCVVGGLVAVVIIIVIILFLSKKKKVGSTDKEMGLQLHTGGPKENNVYDFNMDHPM